MKDFHLMIPLPGFDKYVLLDLRTANLHGYTAMDLINGAKIYEKVYRDGRYQFIETGERFEPEIERIEFFQETIRESAPIPPAPAVEAPSDEDDIPFNRADVHTAAEIKFFKVGDRVRVWMETKSKWERAEIVAIDEADPNLPIQVKFDVSYGMDEDWLYSPQRLRKEVVWEEEEG